MRVFSLLPMPPRHLPLVGLAMMTVASLLGGCIPNEHVDASPVTGQVVDRATRRPIAEAEVVLSAQTNSEARTRTGQDGHFCLPGFRHLVFTPLPYGMFTAPTGYLEVKAPGYRPYGRNEFFPNEEGPGYFNYNGVGSLQQVHVALARKGSR